MVLSQLVLLSLTWLVPGVGKAAEPPSIALTQIASGMSSVVAISTPMTHPVVSSSQNSPGESKLGPPTEPFPLS